ncbi:MAG: SpvB/TcaC N-terminal domain-containing protein, partial [Polyangiaceae bacterium]
GAARTRFPFKFPSARGQAQPSLALAYSSSRGLGMAGVGWSLDVPSITRKGTAGVPRFVDAFPQSATADDYYVNGQLLVAVCILTAGGAGTQCANAVQGEQFPGQFFGRNTSGWTYFRAQIDDGTRYFFSVDGQTWVQQLKDGRLRQYGVALDGLFDDAATERPTVSNAGNVGGDSRAVYRWNLVRESDASGNTVFYVWTHNLELLPPGYEVPNGISYLSDIFDTPAATGGGCGNAITCVPPAPTTFAHHAHLTWTPAFTAHDSTSVPSVAVWQPRPFAQLAALDVTSATWQSTQRQLVRRYELTYRTNFWATANYLQAITLVGQCPSGPIPEGTDGSLPATIPCETRQELTLRSFEYTPEFTQGSGPEFTQVSNIASPQWLTSPSPNVRFIDINGDARADLIYGPLNADHDPPETQAPGPYHVYTLTSPLPADASGAASLLTLSPQNPSGLHGGLLDVAPGASNVVYGDWLSNGSINWLWMQLQPGTSNFSTFEAYTPTLHGLLGVGPVPLGGYSGLVPPWQAAYSADIDGDGLTDMVLVPPYSDPNRPLPLSPPQSTNVTIHDRNGNILPFGFQIGPNSYQGGMDPQLEAQTDGAVRVFADVDGDGLSDAVIVYKDNPTNNEDAPLRFRIFLNDGDGSFQEPGATLPPGIVMNATGDPVGSDRLDTQSIIRMGDLNADGLADLVLLNTTGLHLCLRSVGSLPGATWRCTKVTFQQLGWPDPSECNYSQLRNQAYVSDATVEIADTDGTGIPHVVVIHGCAAAGGTPSSTGSSPSLRRRALACSARFMPSAA